MILQVDKLDVAYEQLCTAIELFFQDKSLISVHNLASSALNILEDLACDSWIQNIGIVGSILAHYDIPNSKKRYKAIKSFINKTWNFFKHAEHDKETIYDYNTKQTELYIFCCTQLIAPLMAEKHKKQYTLLFTIYYVWYIVNNKEILSASNEEIALLNQFLADLPPAWQFISKNKTEFYSEAQIVMEKIEDVIKHEIQHIKLSSNIIDVFLTIFAKISVAFS